jgi:hypothetical protein
VRLCLSPVVSSVQPSSLEQRCCRVIHSKRRPAYLAGFASKVNAAMSGACCGASHAWAAHAGPDGLPLKSSTAVRAFLWRQRQLPTDCAIARHVIAVIANEADPTPPDLWPYPGQRRSEARGRLLLRGALTIGLSALQHRPSKSRRHITATTPASPWGAYVSSKWKSVVSRMCCLASHA